MPLPKEFTYQRFARDKIARMGKTALIAPPGAGKTRPIIDASIQMDHLDPFATGTDRFPHGPILVVCSGPAIATWYKQFPQWAGDPLEGDVHITKGPKHVRVAGWNRAASGVGIYITNASCFRLDYDWITSIKWAMIIADEYHKYMRSRKSETYDKFLRLTRHMESVVLTTGSIISRDPTSMFTAFQIVQPKVFRGYWKFVNTYCITQVTQYGTEIVGIKNIESLRRIMDQYLTYIPEDVVADQLPEGRRQTLDAFMTSKQAKVYTDLSDEMIAVIEESGEVVVSATAMGLWINLRQLLCCPKILDESLGMGGGFELILDKLEETPHAAIFVPFRPAVLYVAEALKAKGHDVVWLMGGVTPEEQTERLEHFRTSGGVIVCTIQYAESFDLETCRHSYFLGYYTLDQNRQAEGRTRRAISEHQYVTWNYTKYLGTLDEVMLAKLNVDMRNVLKVLGRPQAMIDALRGISNE